MKILVINGPNLNMLGLRDKKHYGELTLRLIEERITNDFPEDCFEFFQSNSESEICHCIQKSTIYDGIIINPGAYTHSSIAIRDAMETLSKPIIEVHLSNISSRENFRKTQLTSTKSLGYISGFKENSYLAGVFLLKKMFEDMQIEGAK